MTTKTVTSADGTVLSYESSGGGPPLILVGGAFNDRKSRSAGTPLARLLAPRFTVFCYDRRGRGESHDTPPYAVDREVEDLAAVIGAAGGSAFVYGHSSGAVLALAAAIQQLPITKLALYEPPLMLDLQRASSMGALADQLHDAAASGRRADAVELFLTGVMQMPRPAVEQMQRSPMWAGLEALAHTLEYDVRITMLGPSLVDRASAVRAVTLALNGDACAPWMRDAILALAAAIPGARHRTLAGETHDVNLDVLAGALGELLVI